MRLSLLRVPTSTTPIYPCFKMKQGVWTTWLSFRLKFLLFWPNLHLESTVRKLAPARTKLQLVKATAHHLRSVQRQPERIRKYIEHGPVRYAA